MSEQKTIQILFICMGNICRSPLAEGLFVYKAKKRGVMDRFLVDSAGTSGWHAGEEPDDRMVTLAKRNNVKLNNRARQATTNDFERYDHIICMDDDNREELLAMGAPAEKVQLLLEIDESNTLKEVPDPYYGGKEEFKLVYELIDSACDALLDHLAGKVAEDEA